MSLGIIWAAGLWDIAIWDTAIWEQTAYSPSGGTAGGSGSNVFLFIRKK